MEVRGAVRELVGALDACDVDALSGDEVSSLIDELVPLSRRLSSVVAVLCARGVAKNQHLRSHISGSSWMASKTGVSDKEARSSLKLCSELSALPDVESSVMTGAISSDAASLIVRHSSGDSGVVSELLEVARSSSLDDLSAHIRSRNASLSRSEHQVRLRHSQFVSVDVDSDSMLNCRLRLRPGLGQPLMGLIGSSVGASSWQKAEDFATRLNEILSGAGAGAERFRRQKNQVVFHIDLVSGDVSSPGGSYIRGVGNRALVRGLGVVHRDELLPHLEDSSRALVGTINNKLVWFSEQDQRQRSTKTTELPEFIKRAIKAGSWDTCDVKHCQSAADQVDHIVAKCNEGTNDLENLQSLCEAHHHFKTRRDAPWTTGGIYGKSPPERKMAKQKKAKPTSEPTETMFPDTG